MSSKKNKTSLRKRLILWTTLLLSVSLICVSGTVYYLLSNSLRKSDQELIMKLSTTFAHTYREGGIQRLQEDISPEVLVAVYDKSGKEIFLSMPAYIDHDFEDEDELRQIRKDLKVMPLKEGWKTVLLLSGEEDKDLFHKIEYFFRKKALQWNWTSILPMIDNDMVEIYTTPIHDGQWLRVGRSSEDREEHLATIRNISLIVLVPFIVMGFLMSLFLSHRILAPIKNLALTINRIKEGDQTARARIRGSDDEVDQLARQFNALLDHNEKLVENLKSSIDNVAHDLRTPLTRFRVSAEEALSKQDQNLQKEALSDALETSESILNLLNAIMDVSEAETKTMKLNKETIHLHDFFRELNEIYQLVAEEKEVSLTLNINENITIEADRTRLGQAFGNLLDNAIKFTPQKTQVKLSVSQVGNSALIQVQDEGPGIPEDDKDKIWNRLYRGDKSRSTPGLGIGLSVVRAIILAHDGSISVASPLNQGAIFTVSLPVCNVAVRHP